MAGKVPCYQPWSPELWQFVRRNAWSGKFYLLDVQLGSECNARCGKCDSACATAFEPAELDIDAVARIACEMQKNYSMARRGPSDPCRLQGFICGLGEPTAGTNLQKLKDLVKATKDYGFNWAFFNNGIYWDDELETMLRNGYISVQVQCNGDDINHVMKEMNVTVGAALDQIKHRREIYQLALTRRMVDVMPGTNVCVSIVPMKSNINQVWDWILESVNYNVFPLVAELEEAGYCQKDFYRHECLSPAELSTLRARFWEELRFNYEVPFCPATVGAIHINNRNWVTVEEKTSLSCGWPGMESSGDVMVGDIRTDSLAELSRAILQKRIERIESVRQLVYQFPHMVFGGCGGNVRYLLQDYVRSYDEFVATGGGVISGKHFHIAKWPRVSGACFMGD